MRVFFDTNIILDVLLDRKHFSENALYLMSKLERPEINDFLCATTITTIHYLLSKYLDKQIRSDRSSTISLASSLIR